ncbi:hypothetical protein DUNSADRAFT_7492 [Dunaliella salina]|uniref:Encoded protein n=1 Tax=Dunaliella salina TaxID=3046 RepID=A0ABQ7FTC4_DUNSA|nr:hypothetical protein DUNSADRAFT_7492 [Dunaliella salina]|eukprot:KAF5825705.1 hypothetical protein DUNSADRAFT_7492 [Dunaliella salina]
MVCYYCSREALQCFLQGNPSNRPCDTPGVQFTKFTQIVAADAFESLVPLPEEHSGLSDYAQSTRSLLQTYPPPSPENVVELGDDDTPLGSGEGEDGGSVNLNDQITVAGNATERLAIVNDIISQLGPGGRLQLRKIGGRRLLDGRSLAERMLRDALDAAPQSTSGEITFAPFDENDDGEIDGVDVTITLFYPSGVSDADKEADAAGAGQVVRENADEGNYNSDFQNAVNQAISNQGLSSDLSAQNNAVSFNQQGGFTAVVTGSASSVKAGLLGLFVSAAAVLLLA